MLVTRSMIDEAAHESAIASWKRHGDFVPANVAYLFITEVFAEDRGLILPEVPPAEFADDYDRYCREIRKANSLILV